MKQLTPEVKAIECFDIPDIQTWKPKSPEDIYLAVDVSIGTKDETGSDYFQFLVLSPRSLNKYKDQISERSANRALLLTEFDWDTVIKYIHGKVAQCSGESWEESATSLCRFFSWEYEDYQEEKQRGLRGGADEARRRGRYKRLPRRGRGS
jgi:hypothetical protein